MRSILNQNDELLCVHDGIYGEHPVPYSAEAFKNENGFGSMWFIDVLFDLEIGHQYLLVEPLI